MSVSINASTFPDTVFRQWVLDNITGGSTTLTDTQIAGCTIINIVNKGIANLKGIEYFTALTTLWCGNNQLTNLDVSKNTALKDLSCTYNQLTSLDVSKNTALTDFNCTWNQLTSLDVSRNTALTQLDCARNQLTSLDLSKNTALMDFRCSDNQLTSIDVTKNTMLTFLNCSNNQFMNIDLSKNTALNVLYCTNSQLTSIDLSKNTALTSIYFSSSQLTSLDVSKNTALKALRCRNNRLTSLDLSKNTALTQLHCYGQNHFGLPVAITNNSTYPYQINLGDYVNNISKISGVAAKNSSGETITSSYSNGILMMAEYPQSVTYNYIVDYVQDSTATMDVTITKDLTITTDALDNARHKKSYSQTLEATSESGTLPITWSIVSGTLPPGLTLNTSTGVISGTPT